MKLLQLLLLGLSACIIVAEGPREFSVPKGCKRLDSCQYYASFSIDRNLDLIKVVIEAKQDDSTYTGIGVTEDEKMVSGADFYWGFCGKDGKKFVLNGWLPTIDSIPEKDDEQNLLDPSISYSNGYLVVSFSRKREATHDRDFNFTDADCHHVVFPVGGGKVTEDGLGVEKLSQPPTITSQKICFCEELTTETPEDIIDLTAEPEMTTEPCEKSLLIDLNTYEILFNMTMEDGNGKQLSDEWKTLNGSLDEWIMTTSNDQLLEMEFSMLYKCPENWKFVTLGFKTEFAKIITLKSGGLEVHRWNSKDPANVDEVTAEVSGTVVDNVFQIHITAAAGKLLVEDVQLEVFCSSTPEPCEGREDGLYGYLNDCTKYIQCSNEQPHVMPCPDTLFWDTTQIKCNYKDSLTEVRKEQCHLN